MSRGNSKQPNVILHEDGTCAWLLDVPYPRTFMAWLRQQADFPGRIHDLARDVLADPETATFRSAGHLRQYLEVHGICDAALKTLDEAVMVWNVTYGAAEARQRKPGHRTHYLGADAPGRCQL